MELIINILIFIATFFFMEFTAWFMHKYVMHGFLWKYHEDHHTGSHGFFQRNDVFVLIFAVPSWLFIMFGAIYQIETLIWIGAGIFFYGLIYFLIHESFIHRRFKFFGTKTDNRYFRAIRKAHRMHHKHTTKEDGESFGMLIVDKKYYDED